MDFNLLVDPSRSHDFIAYRRRRVVEQSGEISHSTEYRDISVRDGKDIAEKIRLESKTDDRDKNYGLDVFA